MTRRLTRRFLAPLAMALAIAAAGLAPSKVAAASIACAEVPYSPPSPISSSAYGAHTIRADGTSCVTARRLALRARSRGAFSFLGFRCTYGGPVIRKRWRCYRPLPRAVVTFITIGN